MSLARARSLWIAGLAMLALLVQAAPLGAQQSLSIAAFFGNWKGSAISTSELSIYFRLTERDLDVTIRGAGGGFRVDWTTVQRQKGDPNQPDVRRKSSSLAFVPSRRPGIWREASSGDVLDGGTLSWARVKGNTLTVHRFVIDDQGGFEIQVYKRTLSGLGMDLEFVRIKDGEPVRTAKGSLIKYSN